MHAFVLHAGPILSGLPLRRGPMVEKAVQTLHVDKSRQRRGLTAPQGKEQPCELNRDLRETSKPRKDIRLTGKHADLQKRDTKLTYYFHLLAFLGLTF